LALNYNDQHTIFRKHFDNDDRHELLSLNNYNQHSILSFDYDYQYSVLSINYDHFN
jgi:hypothetical protein